MEPLVKLSDLNVSDTFWEDLFVALANLPTTEWWGICDRLGLNSADTDIEEIIDVITEMDSVQIRNGFMEVFIDGNMSVRVSNIHTANGDGGSGGLVGTNSPNDE